MRVDGIFHLGVKKFAVAHPLAAAAAASRKMRLKYRKKFVNVFKKFITRDREHLAGMFFALRDRNRFGYHVDLEHIFGGASACG